MTMYAPRRIAAFTLIEMIVVITIIMLMFGTLMSGLATMQKATDTLSTPAVIQAVHESCYRNARQFGSAALVYGFTLDFGDGVVSPGDGKTSSNVIASEKSAIAIVPWVIINGTTKYQADIELFTDIGRTPLWNGNRIYFDDKLRPSRQFHSQRTGAALVTHTTSTLETRRYLHVGYEPRTGFTHVYPNATGDAEESTPHSIASLTGKLTAAELSLPTNLPSQLSIELRDTKNNQVKNKILITYTGVIDAHAKL